MEEKGMEINTTKSKVMQVAKTEDLVGQLNIHCKGIQMEQVTKNLNTLEQYSTNVEKYNMK